ncbi:MAG TPA: choice-of-anchor D domain-containing protein [Candidatus Angelobacter sp.]
MAVHKLFWFLGICALLLFPASEDLAQGISVAPASLTFPNLQPVGSPLPGALQIVVTNTGTQPLVITSATVTGDFDFGSDPPSQSVSFGTVQIATGFVLLFNATAAGPRTGTLTLVDNAPGSPHVLTVSGTGFVGPMIRPQLTSLGMNSPIFGPQNAFANIVNIGTDPVTVTGVSISGNGFSQTNNCSTFTVQGQTCQISVVYNPPVAGPQNATISVANTGAANPVTIELITDAADFGFTTDPAQGTATVNAGQKASFPFVASDRTGFDAIAFSCSGLPTGASCLVARVPQTIQPPDTVPAVLTVSTAPRLLGSSRPTGGWGWSLAAVAALTLIPRRKRKLGALLTMLIATTLLGAAVSCGGSSVNPNGTPAGTYNIVLSGTRNGLTRSFSITLTVR